MSRPGRLGRASLAILALWAVVFAPQLFAARAFVHGDASHIRAFAEFSEARWRETRERTHWNPYVFAGVSATASLQDSRPQWLPAPLIDAFDAVHRVPGFPPLAIPLLVHLAGMIAMAALARRLFAAGTPAMIWTGAAWGLVPALLVPFAFGQDWLLMSGALMPVVLLATLRTFDDSGSSAGALPRLRGVLGMALAVAAILLSAHPQIVALTIPLCGAFAVERALALRRPARLLDLGLASVLGAAMSAAVWWPSRLYVAHSVRGGGATVLSEVARWSANGWDLLAIGWPWAAGFGGDTYWGGLQSTDFPSLSGMGVCALALLGLARRDGRERFAWLLAGVAAAGALLALGTRLGPVHAWIHEHVPLWSAFRVAVRSLIVVNLALALLSARGFEHVLEAARRAPRRWLAIAAATAALGLVAAGLMLAGDAYAGFVAGARPSLPAGSAAGIARQAAADLAVHAALLGVLLAGLVAASRPWAWRTPALTLAVLLGSHDPGTVSLPFLQRATGSLEPLAHPPPPRIARLAAADPHGRVLDVSRERLFSNDWIRWRVRSYTGNHPAVARQWDDLWAGGLHRSYPVLCALGVGWLGGASPEPPDSTRFANAGLDSLSGIPVWRIVRALPRAYAAARVVRLPDDGAVLAALGNRELDPIRDVHTVDAGAEGSYGTRCDIQWVRDDPDHVEIETSADSTAFLVLADTWLPGWKASLDGRSIPIARVQHLVRGLVIPAGRHRLRLDYEPEGWPAGVAASRAGWGLWLVGLLVAAARGKAPAPPQPHDRTGHPGAVGGQPRNRVERG